MTQQQSPIDDPNLTAQEIARSGSADIGGTAPDFGKAAANVLRRPAFIIAAVVLLLAAVGLNAAVNFMQLHFKKEPAELSRPLAAISDRFGTWVQVSEDQPLDKEMQDVLGTDKYIFRDYVNESVLGSSVQQTFQSLIDEIHKASTPKEREEAEKNYRAKLNSIRRDHSAAVVSLSVTYYTGMVDTVAHVPDRCVTADGYEPKSYDIVKWPIGRDLLEKDRPADGQIEVRYINFEDQTGTSNVPRSIAYFFHVNGEFNSSPLGVRQKLANLFERKAYYAKIETMTTMSDDKKSAEVLTDFLTSAMPEIQRCMPDWDKEHGRTPKTQLAAAK